jgi:hypothetical protein
VRSWKGPGLFQSASAGWREAPAAADALYDLAFAYAATNLADEARAMLDRLMEVEPESDRGSRIPVEIGPPDPPRPPRSPLP